MTETCEVNKEKLILKILNGLAKYFSKYPARAREMQRTFEIILVLLALGVMFFGAISAYKFFNKKLNAGDQVYTSEY